VRIEKGGKPVVLVAATPFKEEVASHSNMHGIPYLSFVTVDYAQEILPLIPPAVEKKFDKIVKGLTTPAKDLQKKIPGEVI
jgi:hypothetical protein